MSSFQSILQHFQSLGPAISVNLTRELSAVQFRERISDPAIIEATDRLLGAVLCECHSRHRGPTAQRQHKTTVFLLSYLMSGYHAELFDDHLPDRLRQHLLRLAQSLTARFDAIVAAAGTGLEGVPRELTSCFAEEVFAHAAAYEAWAVFDSQRLVGRIQNALESLYSAMWISVDHRPDLMPDYHGRIVKLRAHLAKMDRSTARRFMADDEMRRMGYAVLGRPSVLGTFVAAQRRARFALGLRRTRAARGKLAAFRRSVDRGTGPAASLSFELFAMVAGHVFDV